MSVVTGPKPISLPLPGGREGATVRLHPLLAGEMHSPPGFFERPRGRGAPARVLATPRSRWAWVPLPAFAIEHPGAGLVLVDTGLHPSIAHDPADNLGRLAKLMYTFRFTADQAIPDQLHARGLDPAGVRAVIMTHLHFDHASGVVQFPEATFVVDRREWESAAGLGTLKGYHPRHFDHAFDWRAIDYESAAVDSFATFGRSVDLFGDGSVRLLSTPGHTHGHQSVLLRLRGREALLTADAAYTRRTIDTGCLPLLAADEHLFRRSLAEIRQFLDQTPGALVVPGHDHETWPTLAAVYE